MKALVSSRWVFSVIFVVGLAVVPERLAGQDRSAETKANRWAVLIGVDDYARLHDLSFAGADQSDLREELLKADFDDQHVVLLCDKAPDKDTLPSKANIEAQLERVLKQVARGDMVLVAFSGHGVHIGKTSYFCPADARLDNADSLVSLDWVYELLRKCPAALKVVMVDACRNDPRLGRERSATGKEQLGESQQFVRALERLPEGTVLINSCTEGEVSQEDDKFGHGVFMHFVLQGLKGQADNDGDGHVTLGELTRYAGRQTQDYVARRFTDSQRPKLRGDITLEALDFDLKRIWQRITNPIGMQLVRIQPGKFMMGSHETPEQVAEAFPGERAEEFANEHPRHEVQITKGFYLGAHEVTLGQFARFVQETGYLTDAERGVSKVNPTGADELQEAVNWRNSGHKGITERCPVTLVSWNDAQTFCRWLSRREKARYRLPTQAEWEYCCRAGTNTRYWTGDDPESLIGAANLPDASHRKGKPRDVFCTFRYFAGSAGAGGWRFASGVPGARLAFRIDRTSERAVWVLDKTTPPDGAPPETEVGLATITVLNLEASSNAILHLQVGGQRLTVGPQASRSMTMAAAKDSSQVEGDDGFLDLSPVGSFSANLFGLYDMHGNVWEWCDDGYDEGPTGQGGYREQPEMDPVGPRNAQRYVIRGACYL